MFYGIINEGYIFDSNDIGYNIKEFEDGKVKTLFITGVSGSGKSTLAHKYEKELGVTCYDLLRDIGWNEKLTDEQLKERGPELYQWLKGPGKKYRLDPKADLPELDLVAASADFIRYILSKNIRCIVEGISIFIALHEGLLKIEQFKNSAMIIKGTSAIKSAVRGIKREYDYDKKEDPDLKLKDALPFDYLASTVKAALHDEGIMREIRKKFKK